MIGSFLAFCSVSLILGIFWSATILTASGKAGTLQQTIEQKQDQLLLAQKALASQPRGLKKQASDDDSGGMATFERFHTALIQAANANGVKVNTFSTGPGGLQPHQSLYLQAAPVDAYNQLRVIIDVNGSLGQIVSMLRALADDSVIFEIGALDLARVSDKDHPLTVKAVMNVNILTKAKGAASNANR